MPPPRGRVLAIGGSDSGGGAGIQADVKTIAALRGYAATAITAITAQDTRGVHAIHRIPSAMVARQIAVVLDDIGADAIKTGMLVDAATIEAVCDELAGRRDVPLVLDPVMVAKGGAALLDPAALAALKQRLVPVAALITPNLPEAAALTGIEVRGPDEMAHAAEALLGLGAAAVLLTGGHLPGETVIDLLAMPDSGPVRLVAPRIATRHTHGTGCTLASAVATGLAQGMALADAVRRAHTYVRAAIAAAPGFGAGHGPLGHDAAPACGKTARLHEPRAAAARYDRQLDRVIVELTNGCTFSFPPRLAQGLEMATEAQLAQVKVLGTGYGLHWDALDADLSIPGLLAGLFGTASYMARRVGRATSQAKAAAARVNGAKGGRPHRGLGRTRIATTPKGVNPK